MSRAGLFFIIFLFLSGFFPVFVYGQEINHLIIVEVQIRGEKANNDFIKIYNPLDNDLDISGYRLRKRSSTGRESSIRVFPQGSRILAKNYFLWANSKDNYHLTLEANVWSTSILAKNNSICLLNPEGAILDALSWGEGQNPFVEKKSFPENPGPNQKLERKQTNGVYQDTNNNSRDFFLNPPLESPLSAPEVLLPEAQSQPKIEEITSPTEPEQKPEIKPVTYPSGIVINEILPSPEGPDKTEEWIEIFNQNNFEVDLTDWKIKDIAGNRTTAYTFSEGTKISPGRFLVFYRPTTKITLNNDGDGLNLIQPDGKIIDSVNYEKAPRGQSYNRAESGWVWSAILTPDRVNSIPAQETEGTEILEEVRKIDINTAPLEDLVKIIHIGEVRAEELIFLRPFYSLNDLTKIKGIGNKALKDIKEQGLVWIDPKLKRPKIEETEPLKKGLAAVAEPLKQGYLGREIPKSLSIFLIAFCLAIFSGIIILILKRKLKIS